MLDLSPHSMIQQAGLCFSGVFDHLDRRPVSQPEHDAPRLLDVGHPAAAACAPRSGLAEMRTFLEAFLDIGCCRQVVAI